MNTQESQTRGLIQENISMGIESRIREERACVTGGRCRGWQNAARSFAARTRERQRGKFSPPPLNAIVREVHFCNISHAGCDGLASHPGE